MASRPMKGPGFAGVIDPNFKAPSAPRSTQTPKAPGAAPFKPLTQGSWLNQQAPIGGGASSPSMGMGTGMASSQGSPQPVQRRPMMMSMPESSPQEASVDPGASKGLDANLAALINMGQPVSANPRLGDVDPPMASLLQFFKRKPSY